MRLVYQSWRIRHLRVDWSAAGMFSHFWIYSETFDTHCAFCILYLGRYHSPSDFDEDDARKFLPRFSETNFAKNLEIVEKIKTVADKCNATTSQVALAWILAEHPNCSFLILFIL